MRDKAQWADSEITASFDAARRSNTATASRCAAAPRSNFAFPSAMHALRTMPRCFVRLIALPRNAILYSSSLSPASAVSFGRKSESSPRRFMPPSNARRLKLRGSTSPAHADSTGKRPGKCRSHKRDSRSPRETLPESRRDARSSDTRCSAARPSDKAQSAHPSDTHRCIACNCRKDPAAAPPPAQAKASAPVSSTPRQKKPRPHLLIQHQRVFTYPPESGVVRKNAFLQRPGIRISQRLE